MSMTRHVGTTATIGHSSGYTLADTQARVAIGNNFGCALSFNGQVNCWGLNDHGQHGDNSPNATANADATADTVMDLQ